MKKFLVCLMCCFGIFTLCSATSTLEDVYLNNFDILVNGETYSPTLPVLNYQGRTYLPLNEFGSMTGNDISFANNTISIDSNSADSNFHDIFYVYSNAATLRNSIQSFINTFTEIYYYYILSAVDRSYVVSIEEWEESLREADEAIDITLKTKEYFAYLCEHYGLSSQKDIEILFSNIETYCESVKIVAETMKKNAILEDYSFNFATPKSGMITDLLDSTLKLQNLEIKATQKIYE